MTVLVMKLLMVDGSHMQNTDCVISKPPNIYGENHYVNY